MNQNGRYLQRFGNFDSLQAKVATGVKEHSWSRPNRTDVHVIVVLSPKFNRVEALQLEARPSPDTL